MRPIERAKYSGKKASKAKLPVAGPTKKANAKGDMAGVKRKVAPTPGRVVSGVGARRLRHYRAVLREADLAHRIELERAGVAPLIMEGLITETGVSAAKLQVYLGIPKATYTKKAREKTPFTGAHGQAVIGVVDLINMVEDMLNVDADNERATDFDVEKWFGEWIQRPQPLLAGMKPAQLLDTPTGRESVKQLLGSIQSGAYQ